MFAGKARSLPYLMGAPHVLALALLENITLGWNRISMGKRFSVFGPFVSYEEKRIVYLAPDS
jgi:hypothetical protein